MTRGAWGLLGLAAAAVVLAGPLYVAWATWDLYKNYEQGDMFNGR